MYFVILPLVSPGLGLFLSLYIFPLKTLTVLSNTRQIACRLSQVWIYLVFSFSCYTMVMDFWKEYLRGKVPFVSYHIGGTWYSHTTAGGGKLQHVVKVMSATLIHCKERSLEVQTTLKGARWELNVTSWRGCVSAYTPWNFVRKSCLFYLSIIIYIRMSSCIFIVYNGLNPILLYIIA